MCDKYCFENHSKDAVCMEEANVCFFLALRQYSFFCCECREKRVASYISLRKGKKDGKAIRA